jgi:hypothetical protein
VCDGKVQDGNLPSGDDQHQAQDFTWPMGDCDSGESIQMRMPLDSIRSEDATGGNIRINWKQSTESTSAGVRLHKEGKSSPQ